MYLCGSCSLAQRRFARVAYGILTDRTLARLKNRENSIGSESHILLVSAELGKHRLPSQTLFNYL